MKDPLTIEGTVLVACEEETKGHITIPDGVTEIGNGAFFGCSGLTSITIPKSVTQIGDGAFISCEGLTSITIPYSVTEIGEDALVAESLTSIIVDERNEHYCVEDGILYSKDKSLLHTCPARRTGDVIIPDSVTEIGDYAFENCKGLTYIEIPDSVTEIGVFAFTGCEGLTSITIPDSVTQIQMNAFDDCKGLSCINIPNSVIEMGMDTLEGCEGLQEIHCRIKNIYNVVPYSIDKLTNYFNNPFGNIRKSQIVLYVPNGTGEAYRNHPQFQDFKEIVEEE